MDILLDTHIFIWFLNGDEQLSYSNRKLIEDDSNNFFLSIASIWEIAIKHSLQKLELKGNFSQICVFLTENDIKVLSITFEHIQHLLNLEGHHRDPFDRMIIAQAKSEQLKIVTKDRIFMKYEVEVIS